MDDSPSSSSPALHRGDGSSLRGRRVRNFQRSYKACELCRKKKIRCIVDDPGTSCLRCLRESKTCVFSEERTHRKQSITSNCRPSVSGEEADDYDYAPIEIPSPIANTQNDAPNQQQLPSSGYDTVMQDLPREANSATLSDSLMRTLVTNSKDAMNLLFQAAVERADTDTEETTTNSPPTSRTRANASAEQPTPGTTASTAREILPLCASSPSPEVVRLWRAFRFTKMGWFTAEEAITYVDLFHKNLAPLSPVSKGLDPSHDNHYKLITQEPLLCCVILMISSRYHVLKGAGGLARSTLIHHRLWEHCQHLIMRLMFGHEKRSKAKTRTRGSIEALLLIIEWHPRAIHLPPAADGWDSSVLLTESDPRDDPWGNQAEVDDTKAYWLRDVITPARISDRMSWMLLGCVQSLALELGICDVGDPSDLAATPSQLPDLRAKQARLRQLMYIFMEQQSSRLGCPSMIPASLSQLLAEPTDNSNRDSAMIMAWLDLTRLMRTIIDVLFPSASATRDAINSGRYVTIIKHFQQQLSSWKATHLHPNRLSPHDFEDVSIEFNHLRAFMNSLGIQAVVERVLGKGAQRLASTDILQSSITSVDYAFVKEVIDGSCQVLESVNRISQAGSLRHCPIRIFLRIITASIFLLKALSLGTRTANLQASLTILETVIQALQQSNLDDMHLACRYGELLDMHLQKFRQGMIAASIPQGISPAHANDQLDFYGSTNNEESALNGMQFGGMDDWMALPFDPSVAPFGFWNGSDVLESDDRSWDFIWNLPNV